MPPDGGCCGCYPQGFVSPTFTPGIDRTYTHTHTVTRARTMGHHRKARGTDVACPGGSSENLCFPFAAQCLGGSTLLLHMSFINTRRITHAHALCKTVERAPPGRREIKTDHNHKLYPINFISHIFDSLYLPGPGYPGHLR